MIYLSFRSTIVLLILLFTFYFNSQGQNYIIDFSGTGNNSNIDSVEVENLTKGTSLKLIGNQALHLKETVTDINELNQFQKKNPLIYPNPFIGECKVKFIILEAGVTKVSVFDMSGKLLVQKTKNLSVGEHYYLISGFQSGVYFMQTEHSEITRVNKLISVAFDSRNPQIVYSGNNEINESYLDIKKASDEILMEYENGDMLKFIGFSGKNATVITDVPTSSKNIQFTFIPCIDSDGKNYPAVKIGNQWWMAENLAYLPEVSPPTDGSISEPKYYVFGYDGNDINEAKATNYYSTYGILYNWPAALSCCPEGWHLPSTNEWEILMDYLGGREIAAIKLKETGTEHWNSNPNATSATNSSGFTALPGGDRFYTASLIGSFGGIWEEGNWWTSTESDSEKAWTFDLYEYDDYAHLTYWILKENGASVRCIAD